MARPQPPPRAPSRKCSHALYRFASVLLGAATLGVTATAGAAGGTAEHDSVAATARLPAVYPDALDRIDGNALIWRDGTRMDLDDGKGLKPFAAWLAAPDIEDMLRIPYPAGAGPLEPPPESDPGRARNAAFFDKMYGNCRKGEVAPHLETVIWLPLKSGQHLKVTGKNSVADRLQAVSDELDALPASFDKYLIPSAGTYNCRAIAGTDRVSAHGYGIAIDLAVSQSDYWRWAAEGPARIAYRNRIPLEIVHIFERHGFIWGGRWYHYDTMHFEYRPELLPPLAPLDAPNGPPALWQKIAP